ncbi:hypothetical protein GYH30_001912 [Glycine max]|nr:hypothetical protein GYH30_001912 [Glycine max]
MAKSKILLWASVYCRFSISISSIQVGTNLNRTCINLISIQIAAK